MPVLELSGLRGAFGGTLRALTLLLQRRRPRMRAAWINEDLPDGRRYEGLWIEAIGGRRPIDVYEVGIRARHGRRRKGRHRRERETHVSAAAYGSKRLSVRLGDGDVLTASWPLDHIIDDLQERIGDAMINAQTKVFVRGSGKRYTARIGRDK